LKFNLLVLSVVLSLIDLYSSAGIKLQVMDQIIEQLTQFKNSNTKENEKSTI